MRFQRHSSSSTAPCSRLNNHSTTKKIQVKSSMGPSRPNQCDCPTIDLPQASLAFRRCPKSRKTSRWSRNSVKGTITLSACCNKTKLCRLSYLNRTSFQRRSKLKVLCRKTQNYLRGFKRVLNHNYSPVQTLSRTWHLTPTGRDRGAKHSPARGQSTFPNERSKDQSPKLKSRPR